MNDPNIARLMRRRAFLNRAGLGFGGLALNSMLANETPTGDPHFQPKAKSVIWMFMRGGVSHMESFDPKPELTKYEGKSITPKRPTPMFKIRSVSRRCVSSL